MAPGEWYYSFQGLEFVEIWQQDHELSKIEFAKLLYNSDGPFKTFTEAKEDALERFRCDRSMANVSITNILLARKKDIK